MKGQDLALKKEESSFVLRKRSKKTFIPPAASGGVSVLNERVAVVGVRASLEAASGIKSHFCFFF
jgi:hypothetical protein